MDVVGRLPGITLCGTTAADPPPPADLPDWLVTALTVVGLVVALLVLALVARGVWQALRAGLGWLRRLTGARPGAQTGAFAAGDVGSELRTRIDAAADALAQDAGPPGDAVIACWLDLEAAAAATGTPRAAAQTATEFTAQLLRRHTVAEAGVDLDTLLHLYQRARFSATPTTAADVEVARRCLRRIAAGIPEPAERVDPADPSDPSDPAERVGSGRR